MRARALVRIPFGFDYQTKRRRGEYMLRALALMRGDETTAIFPDQLMNVWLFVVGPIEGPVPEATSFAPNSSRIGCGVNKTESLNLAKNPHVSSAVDRN